LYIVKKPPDIPIAYTMAAMMTAADTIIKFWILANSSAAWWIAFGPHGPRAEDPPGEWTKILLYSALGVGISGVIFFGIHSFARPPPRTMTKEWQEATNEYLRVRSSHISNLQIERILTQPRPRNPTPSTVSAAKDTKERATCKANPLRLKASVSKPKNRFWSDEEICICRGVMTAPRLVLVWEDGHIFYL
jgi:Cytochrome c oxidase subunit IV